MNRFNKKSRNNAKEKHRLKRDAHRDRSLARQTAASAKTGEPVLPKAKVERLAVSGKRTGKFKRKVVRKWQKSRGVVSAMETGEVTMEDIVMYASQSSKKDKDSQDKAEEAAGGMDVKPASKSGQVYGFRVKPSKKARLKLRKRSMAVEGSAAAGEDMME